MKHNIKTIGIDDASFCLRDPASREVLVVGVVLRANHYLEGVVSSHIEIDGTNATRVLADMVRETRHFKQLKAIFLDGITMGGFNVVDLERLFELTNLPILSLTRAIPDFSSIEAALKKHFTDGQERWRLVERGTLHSFSAGEGEIFGKIIGLSQEQAQELIDITTWLGQLPEPIRMAHLMATGVVNAESTKRA